MHRLGYAAIALAALISCISIYSPAQARWAPSGSYERSCRNINFDGDTLTASCRRADGYWRNTWLPNADNCDKITDFTSGTDKIVLSEGAFGDLGPTGHPMQAKYFHAGAVAQTSDQHILYTQSDGHLYYDDDATGPDQPSLFAVLTTEPTIHPGDFLIEA